MVDSLSSYHTRRAIFIERLGGRCVSCGSIEGLEFDHVDPETKDFNVSKRLTQKMEKILPEIDKCQLLCGSCHAEKTRDQEGRAEHGGKTMYSRGCRCEACVTEHRNYYREYTRKNAEYLNAKRREKRLIARKGVRAVD